MWKEISANGKKELGKPFFVSGKWVTPTLLRRKGSERKQKREKRVDAALGGNSACPTLKPSQRGSFSEGGE